MSLLSFYNLILLAYYISKVGYLIIMGIWAATLSSPLGTIIGGPRVMQAVAKDGILPAFLPKDTARRTNPAWRSDSLDSGSAFNPSDRYQSDHTDPVYVLPRFLRPDQFYRFLRNLYPEPKLATWDSGTCYHSVFRGDRLLYGDVHDQPWGYIHRNVLGCFHLYLGS